MRRIDRQFSEFSRLNFRDIRILAIGNVIDNQLRWPLWIGRIRLIPFAIHLIPDAVDDDALLLLAVANHRPQKRLERMPEAAGEYSMVRTYLEWLCEMPWAIATSDDLDLRKVRAVLDEATGRWGVRVNRVELKAIDPPPAPMATRSLASMAMAHRQPSSTWPMTLVAGTRTLS